MYISAVLLLWLAEAAAFYLLWKAAKLVYFTRQARRTGLPYIWTPIHELEVWAYFTNVIIRQFYQDHVLQNGQGWPRWCRFMVKDWMYEDKFRTHAALGETFLVVSPGGLVCYTANADFGMTIVTRRREFRKAADKMKMLEPFGPNIVSVDGSLWKLHYKMTASSVGDKINEEVWNDTQRQTTALKETWAKNGVEALKADVYSLGVSVMAYAGFGHRDLNQINKQLPAGHKLSVVQCLCAVIASLPAILLLPRWALARFAKRTYTAHQEFESYTRELIAEARTESGPWNSASGMASGKPGTLLSNIVRQNKIEDTTSSPERTTLTDEEVLGNIFIYFMAGYDTTANTIIFSCVLMALYPELQQRACEEVDRATKASQQAGRSRPSYADDFAQLDYLLAFMYEVLRVFPIVLQIPRVLSTPTEVTFPGKDGSTHNTTLPSGCSAVVNITGLHYNEVYWPEPAVFEPQRWLSANPNTYVPSASKVDRKTNGLEPTRIPGHARGTFMTFSEGSRACIGKRFAAAEYVAFWSELLRDYELALAPGVDRAHVERVFRRCSAGSPISLQPPMDVRLRLIKRQ